MTQKLHCLLPSQSTCVHYTLITQSVLRLYHTHLQKLLQHAYIPQYIAIQHVQQTSLKRNAVSCCGADVFPLLDVTPTPDTCFPPHSQSGENNSTG